MKLKFYPEYYLVFCKFTDLSMYSIPRNDALVGEALYDPDGKHVYFNDLLAIRTTCQNLREKSRNNSCDTAPLGAALAMLHKSIADTSSPHSPNTFSRHYCHFLFF